MLTFLGLKFSYETLFFFLLFIASEVIGASPLAKNSVVQVILGGINTLKPLRSEDDKIQKVRETINK